jgi:hypothetical protein
MRLVNCPVCGTRCSADTEKCPECGFEIRQYFESKKIPEERKKQPHIKAVCALGAVLIIFFMLFSFLILNSEKTDSDTITKSAGTTGPTSVSVSASKSASTSASSKHPADELSSNYNIDVSGVYSGDDHEILVLNSDGLAYYYCFSIEYTELECPWYIRNDTVYIEFSRMHCTVFAKIDEKELIFKSDSINWNPEVFTRLNIEPEQYLTKLPSTNDPNATLNRDGSISYTNDGITYTLPKMFLDMKDEYDSIESTSIFIDEDVQSDYLASATFHSSEGRELTPTLAETLAQTLASAFYKKTTVSNCTGIEIAGHRGYRFDLTGFLNKGFNPLEGYEIDGSIIVFYNESTGNNNYIMMVQTSNRALDDTVIFEEILQSAKNT